MLVDYHIHTNFSRDCDTLMSDQCRAAVLKGVKEVAFTEHEDYNPGDWTSFFFDHSAYMAELWRCRKRFEGELVIRAGIEISEPHLHTERTAKVLRDYEWDFVLGSLHWLPGRLPGEINASRDDFFTYANDWRQSFRDYFTEMVEMARHGDFDVLAHIDYPARYGPRFYGDAYDVREYEPIICDVLRGVIERGKGIEINTTPWRKGLPEPNPPHIVIQWYRELGGEILTLGSDSHAAKDLGADIPRAMQVAREAGFIHIATFEKRQSKFVPID